MSPRDPIEELKFSAEKCMKSGKYAEAFFHWTKAIHMAESKKGKKLDTNMFAQRAKCFIQNDQFYFALEDANKVIDIEPNNIMGHLRLAEVYFETGHYTLALPEISKCFTLSQVKAEKDYLLEWQRKCRRDAAKQKMKDEQLPYVGAAIGIVIASLGVVADALAYGSSSYIAHPVLKAIIVIIIAGSCFLVAYLIQRQTINSRKALLEPPIDLFGGGSNDANNINEEPKPEHADTTKITSDRLKTELNGTSSTSSHDKKLD